MEHARPNVCERASALDSMNPRDEMIQTAQFASACHRNATNVSDKQFAGPWTFKHNQLSGADAKRQGNVGVVIQNYAQKLVFMQKSAVTVGC